MILRNERYLDLEMGISAAVRLLVQAKRRLQQAETELRVKKGELTDAPH